MKKKILHKYAMTFIGTRYFYTGDDPISGFDCSGFVCELLRACGLVPYKFRTNAQGIYEHLKASSKSCLPEFGALMFFGKSATEISHIGFCLDSDTMIEAGGGDSETISEAVASDRNAFVRLRPVGFRKDLLFTILPNYQFGESE